MRHKKFFKYFDFEISFHPTRTFFSVMLVVIAVVLVWWGIWKLLDAYFFPNHPLMAAILAIFLGVLILYLPDKDIKDLL